jgi:predicted PhzF superfamily epimerase YddE/YHI9
LSPSVPFAVVDVFADAPLVGNALAVVTDAEGLEESVMRAVAREFNQSETTFVLPATQPGATWRLRSFTPAGAEVVGAGHNALGAWWWLADGRTAGARRSGERFASAAPASSSRKARSPSRRVANRAEHAPRSREQPMTEADEHHLRRAIALASAARAAGDMPYGSLLIGPGG